MDAKEGGDAFKIGGEKSERKEAAKLQLLINARNVKEKKKMRRTQKTRRSEGKKKTTAGARKTTIKLK